MNNHDEAPERVEAYIQDHVDFFLRECQLENREDLNITFQLYINVGEEKFAVYAGHERRKDERIIWIFEKNESEHRYDTRYKQGDI